MAKNKQTFRVGEIAMLEGKHRVKILNAFPYGHGEWWYEVEGIDLIPPIRMLTREVPQSALEKM